LRVSVAAAVLPWGAGAPETTGKSHHRILDPNTAVDIRHDGHEAPGGELKAS
jgi:hypothetical protein